MRPPDVLCAEWTAQMIEPQARHVNTNSGPISRSMIAGGYRCDVP
jgi:hypothetical protein